MTILIVGASGATGKKLVEQLLDRGHNVKVIVRSPENLPDSWKNNTLLSIISASVLDLSDTEMAEHLEGCQAVASCLGHNITRKGMFGKPRKLVTDATRRLTNSIKSNKPKEPVKYVLMNTIANSNRDLNEPISFGQRIVIGLLRLLLPPHADNEKAADYLRTRIGQNDQFVEWVAVRPDSLINEEEVSEYELYPSPIKNAVFNARKTSRINVGHFMAELITNDDTWNTWKGQMPVLSGEPFSE
jgi:NAD(P)-dependent dehydrogenase (short-subunit alcohol dehydrogenase family)